MPDLVDLSQTRAAARAAAVSHLGLTGDEADAFTDVLLRVVQALLPKLREIAVTDGYAQAVAYLRDDERYRNWWSGYGAWQHKPTGRYWDPAARGYLANYLETVGPDGRNVAGTQKGADHGG